MLVNRDTKFGIAIAIVVGTLILVTALAASAETNYVQIAIYGEDQSVNEDDQVNAEENGVNNDQSTNGNPTQNNEDLDTNRDNADLESKDADNGQPEQQGSNVDSEQETLETDRKTMLVKGIPDIERFLPTSKMASGDIVDVPIKGDSTEGNIASLGKMASGDEVDSDDAIIVRSDPIDHESYIICESNHLSYQCVSHPYPEDTTSGD
jgi:hypothetical protein